jgi:hypothetical protein
MTIKPRRLRWARLVAFLEVLEIHTTISEKTLKGRDYTAILNLNLEKQIYTYVDWIQLIQDRFQWRVFGSTEKDIWFHKRREMS